ncbi:Thioredoxin-like 4A [Physocladia obscura]|uniref:Thioredoxin-like 4A n=1 Tax=Physocladia obscura TaxID=109957 RepID=A0AAD5T9Q8_9FUNG|nr:Thioredoxin-like 4A [Physocladia obscura]
MRHVDQAILSEEDRVVIIRFGHDWDTTCMQMDEVLYSISEKIKNFAVIYLCDITEVPDFNKMYEIYDPCTVMFFYRNKHIMVDLGTGNNNKINWAMEDKQEMIDIVETVFQGARKGRGLVISPKADDEASRDSQSDSASSVTPPQTPRTPRTQAKRKRKSGSDNGNSDSGESTPKAKPTLRQKGRPKGQKQQQTSHASKKQQPESAAKVGGLFDILVAKGSALASAVSEWVDDWNEDENAAMVELINFILETSGCNGKITADLLEDEDLIKEALEELQSQISSSENYPLIAKKSAAARRTSTSAKLRSNLTEFWTKWFLKLKNLPKDSPIFAIPPEDDIDEDSPPPSCFELLKTWLTLMSSSTFRAFRHTSTAIILILMTNLCDAAAGIHEEWTTLSRQLETLQKNKSSANSDRLLRMELEVETLATKKEILEKHMSDLFESVFIHRYRDIDSTIRAECIKELGIWITKFPDHYLDSFNVRLETLKSLHTLYTAPATTISLRPFTERFKPRILEMSLREAHPACRVVAVELIGRMSAAGLISDNDRAHVMPLLFCADDSRARAATAIFAGRVVADEIIPQAIEDAEAVIGEDGADGDDAGKNTSFNFSWVCWKAIAGFLVGVGNQVQANVMKQEIAATAENLRRKKKDSVETVVPSSQSFEASLSLPSQQTQENADDDDEEEIDEDDLDEELKDQMIAKLRFLSELRDWCYFGDELVDVVNKEHVDNFVSIGSGNMNAAISALLGQVEFLKEWESILEYLSSDLTIGNANDDASQRELAVLNLHRLSDDQEYCLILILNGILANAETGSQEEVKGKKNLREEENEEDMEFKSSRILIKYLPKLLKKYGNEYEGTGHKVLIEVIKLVRHLNIVAYLELRMLKVYDSLLEDLMAILLRQSKNEILGEFMQTFSHLIGKQNSMSRPDATPKKGKRALAMETDSLALSTGLHKSAYEKLEDAIELEILPQVFSFGQKYRDDIESGSKLVPSDIASGLLASLRRLRAVSAIVDTSNMKIRIDGNTAIDENLLLEETIFNALNPIFKAVGNYSMSKSSRLDILNSDDLDSSKDVIESDRVASDILSLLIEHQSQDVLLSLSEFVQNQQQSNNNEDEEEMSDLTLNKLTAIIKVCEEIIVGDHTKSSYSVGVQMSATRALFDIFTALLFCKTLPLRLSIGLDTQAAIVEFTVKCFEAVGIFDRALKSRLVATLCNQDIILKHTRIPKIEAPEIAESTMVNLLHICVGLCNLIGGGVLDVKYAAYLLQFDGIVETDVTNSSFVVIPSVDTRSFEKLFSAKSRLFGAGWDTCMEIVAGRIIGERVLRYLESYEGQNEDYDQKIHVDKVRTVIEETGLMIGDSLNMSLDLFVYGKVGSLQHMEALSKLFMGKLQLWITQLGDDNDGEHDRVYLQAVATRTLLILLRKAIDHMAEISSAATKIKQPIRKQAKLFGNSESILHSLEEITHAWIIWGALGGMIAKIIASFGVGYEARPEDAGISSIRDILEYAEKTLAANGIKPVESDVLWQPYFAFYKALENADPKIKKERKKKLVKDEGDSTKKSQSARNKSKPHQKNALSFSKDEINSGSQVVDSEDKNEQEEENEGEEVPLIRRRAPQSKKNLKEGNVKSITASKNRVVETKAKSNKTKSSVAKKKQVRATSQSSDSGDENRQEEEEEDLVHRRMTSTKQTNDDDTDNNSEDDGDDNDDMSASPLPKKSTKNNPIAYKKSGATVLGKRNTRSRSRLTLSSGGGSEKSMQQAGDSDSNERMESDADEEEEEEEIPSSPESQMRTVKRVRL